MARIITVTSGKGGVGKTNISANLALHLAELGYNTCLFDADLGLANINILLKIYPEHNLKDVILYQKDIKEILIENYEGIDIIPGSSGVEEMANLTPDQIVKLIKQFSKLDAYDYFIIDTAAGISKDVISFALHHQSLWLS
jgi:flagellar biosynthesis protein FlhG